MRNELLKLPKPFTVLAPMDDVTDAVFRSVVANILAPPDLFFTEFVNVEALQSPGRESAMRRLKYSEDERPIIAQIWGKNPENFYKTAQELVEMGFDGVDLNMGCPEKSVVRNITGGGLIKEPQAALAIIDATRRGLDGKIPLSVKTRIGFNQYDPEWIKVLLAEKLNMLSIHLRTVKEMSKVPAHWELAAEIKRFRDEISPETLLVGNGDVMGYHQAIELATSSGLDGIMVGRGIFHDPFVFASDTPWQAMTPLQKVSLYKEHVLCFQKIWGDTPRPIAPLNKFCKTYINGFDGAKDFREKLMSSRTLEELLDQIKKIEKSL